MELKYIIGFVIVSGKYEGNHYWAKVCFNKDLVWEKTVGIIFEDSFNENLPLDDINEFHKVNINDIVFDEKEVVKYVPKVVPTPPDWEFCMHVDTSSKALEILRKLENLGFKKRYIDTYTYWRGGLMYVKNGVLSDKPVEGLEEWMPAYLDWKCEVL